MRVAESGSNNEMPDHVRQELLSIAISDGEAQCRHPSLIVGCICFSLIGLVVTLTNLDEISDFFKPVLSALADKPDCQIDNCWTDMGVSAAVLAVAALTVWACYKCLPWCYNACLKEPTGALVMVDNELVAVDSNGGMYRLMAGQPQVEGEYDSPGSEVGSPRLMIGPDAV